MSYKTTHAPRVISTATKPTATVNVFGEDLLVKSLVAEYAPIVAAKAAKNRANAKLLADLKAKYGSRHAK